MQKNHLKRLPYSMGQKILRGRCEVRGESSLYVYILYGWDGIKYCSVHLNRIFQQHIMISINVILLEYRKLRSGEQNNSERPKRNFTETEPKPKHRLFTEPKPNRNRNSIPKLYCSKCSKYMVAKSNHNKFNSIFLINL